MLVIDQVYVKRKFYTNPTNEANKMKTVLVGEMIIRKTAGKIKSFYIDDHLGKDRIDHQVKDNNNNKKKAE